MLLTVPTYRRHSNGEAQTLDHWPESIPLTLVVREEESAEYRSLLRESQRTRDDIWEIPTGAVSGIATTRQWIVDEALRRGHDKIVMIDDDLHFIVRGKVGQDEPGWDYKLRPCELSDFVCLVDWLDGVLEKYQHCAVSMREGNNRTPGLGVYEECTRGIRVVGYRTEEFAAGRVRFREEVEGREDLDVTLQMLRLGHPNVVTFHWAQGQRSADAPGGLQGSRNGAQLDRTAELLTELHPGLVRTRQKYNRSGAMAGWRTEVTIQWKRALGIDV